MVIQNSYIVVAVISLLLILQLTCDCRNKKSCSQCVCVIVAVKLGPKFSETVKGKLSLGAKIIQEGGRRNIFKHVFGMQEEEKLLKASQCYLYTTAGPIAGIFFVSTVKVAFCSERHTSFSSANGELVKAPYKVSLNFKTNFAFK